jgi:hypothetical protein
VLQSTLRLKISFLFPVAGCLSGTTIIKDGSITTLPLAVLSGRLRVITRLVRPCPEPMIDPFTEQEPTIPTAEAETTATVKRRRRVVMEACFSVLPVDLLLAR